MIGLLLALLIAAVCSNIGLPLIRRLDDKNALTPLEQALAGFIVGALGVHYVVWAVGTSIYGAIPMAVILAVCAIPFGAKVIVCIRSRSRLPRLRLPIARLEMAVLCLIVVLLVGMVVGAAAPPADGDSVRYHLLLPARDLELGRIRPVPGWSIYDYFPALMEMLYRLILPLGNGEAAQQLHVVFTCAAAAATFALATRSGLERPWAAMATLMFLGIRVVMYQSSTADIDQGLTASVAVLALAVLAWRATPTPGLTVLIGLLTAAAVNIKFNGAILAFAMAIAALTTPGATPYLLKRLPLIIAIAVIALIPVMLRAWADTGNPIFPIYHQLFDHMNVDIFGDTLALYKRGRSFLDFLIGPFLIFYAPDRFDGHQIGTPYLLIFAPLAFVGRRPSDAEYFFFAFLAIFFVLWFWAMPQQVRFLVPALPTLAVPAAAGARQAWAAVNANQATRTMFLVLCSLIVTNQLLYFTGTAIRRFPVALSLATPESYLTSPPYFAVTHFEGCSFITERLRSGGRWLNLALNNSVYCPQGQMASQVEVDEAPLLFKTLPLPRLTADQVIAALRKAQVRLILVDSPRRPAAAYEAHERVRDRYDPLLSEALKQATPILQSKFDAVYDAEAIIMILAGRIPDKGPE